MRQYRVTKYAPFFGVLDGLVDHALHLCEGEAAENETLLLELYHLVREPLPFLAD